MFPNYEIIEQIYEGRNTLIYRAIRTLDRIPVIIKLLKKDHPSSIDLTRLNSEYEIAKQIESSGVVKPLAIETHQTQTALILEDFGGKDLSQFPEFKKADIKTFLKISIKLADTLGEIHSKHVIHKDIKPRNRETLL
jgi:serine/threonine protein kinase